MIGKLIRNTINLLLYGGGFIGLGAACMTALSFEIIGTAQLHLNYIFFVGTSTSALYCVHRVVGIKRFAHITNSPRLDIIRKYQSHIWVYGVMWSVLCLWFFIALAEPKLILALIPGGIIAGGYVLPILPGKKRLRDLGWGKILLIGWSWGWLTAYVPFLYFADASFFLASVHGIERMLFIILITIPFEIRDIAIDQSVGLVTMPMKFGRIKTFRIAILIFIFIILLSSLSSFHYLNPAYTLTMLIVSLITLPLIKVSYKVHDDYYFSGLIDGLMILALLFFTGIHLFI